MTAAIRDAVPAAIALVISAAPILALVLLMVTSRPVAVSATFLLGWASGIFSTAVIIVAFADASAPRAASGGLSIPGAIIRIVLGALLGTLAARAWSTRASAGPPKWMSGVTGWSRSRALTVGYLMGSINPKNVALVAVGATSILEATAIPSEQAVAIAVFAAVASLGIATPIALQLAGGPAVHRGLGNAADWMKLNGKTISVVVLAIIAVVLVVKGVRALV